MCLKSQIKLVDYHENVVVLNILKECFDKDRFFEEIKQLNGWNSLLPNIWYSIHNEACYGYYVENKLVGILLTVDYFQLKAYPELYQNIFRDSDTFPALIKIEDMMSKLSKNSKYIVNICVLPKYQGRGIAGELLTTFIRENKGCDFAVDISNSESLSLYTKRGFEFKKVEKDYYLAWKWSPN